MRALFLLLLAGAAWAGVDHAPFDAILKANVRDERVDYVNIKKRHAPALKAYLDRLAKADVARASRNEKLAFYINLYNATMIQAVIRRYKPGWTPAADDFAVFKAPLVRAGGKRYSLNHLENEVIRPTFKDARIHVALVCGARSCPPLLPRAYRAAGLDKVLDANMRRFVRDPFRNPADHERKRIRVSKIFEWYAADFGGKDKLLAYVDKWHDRDLSRYTIDFVDYSWELNITSGA